MKKTVTIEEFMKFNPCYSEDKIRRIAGDKTEWSALDILRLDDVPAADRLWAVLRKELIDTNILHEFACWCAEQVLALVENPDPRSIAAIAAKRAWLRGEITDDELKAASHAAARAANAAASWAARAAWAAKAAASHAAASHAADRAAYRAASWAASWAARAAATSARAINDARNIRDKQVKTLIEMLEEAKDDD